MRIVEVLPADRSSVRHVMRSAVVALITLSLLPTTAEARHHHHRGRIAMARHMAHRVAHAPRHVRPGSYTPPFSAYAVDGNSGRVLYGDQEDGLRHPASLTKVMTLYLLFEQLEKKRLSLDSELQVSVHAASQEPTKLGLRPGSHIRVEDAIKAIVTKSANDMAVAVAERIGGDEDTFARMMTRKAHALGMSRTHYVNASGLPNDEQWTSAKDMVTLGRAIHDHYPRYYHFFSTPSFRYAGQFMPNHNHLMEHVEGMDGIKTGYTRASGFNLLTSVSRNGHYLVSAVLGGKTRLGRDRIMADLIEAQINKCATVRTAATIQERPTSDQVAEAIPVVEHVGQSAPAVESVSDDEAEATPDIPVPVADPAKLAFAEEPPPDTRARPAFVSGLPKGVGEDTLATGSIRPRQAIVDGSTARVTDVTTMTPSARRGARIAAREAREAQHDARTEAVPPVRMAKAEIESDDSPRAAPAHSGWMIQIGATDTVARANDLLARAKAQSRGTLVAAKPFTERVQKGSATLYRARFAGLEADSAEGACKALKRSGMSCFATKN